MSTTYDPKDPRYLEEGDLREEYGRVFDLCSSCRLCWNVCPSFGSLFDMIDAKDGKVETLTEKEQDRVVDECYQCKLCYLKCPYVPPHEWELDFPRLMLRGTANKHEHGGGSITDQALGRTDAIGKLSSAVAPLVNMATGKPGSLPRKLMEKTAGIAQQRILPSYAGQRFSTWFRKRKDRAPAVEPRNGNVAIFQTCLVEYQNPNVGKAAVGVLERNGIACDAPEGTVCCGMPWLDAGNTEAFLKQAEKNVSILAEQVRQGRDIVVLQPTCGYVLKKEYPGYLGGEDAELVAAHTYDVSEYLMDVHRAEGKGLDTAFSGSAPKTITWHQSCHLRAQNIGLRGRDLLKLTGAEVVVVDKCSGIDGTWGLRASNYEMAKQVAQPLREAIEKAGSDVVAGDCHLANGAILEETGKTPLHPIQVLARAYGIDEEQV